MTRRTAAFTKQATAARMVAFYRFATLLDLESWCDDFPNEEAWTDCALSFAELTTKERAAVLDLLSETGPQIDEPIRRSLVEKVGGLHPFLDDLLGRR